MSIGSIASKGLNYAGRLIFDDKFSQGVTKTLKVYRRQKKAGVYTGNFKNMVVDSFKRADRITEKNVWQGLKNSVVSYGDDVAKLWKNPSVGFFKKIGGTLKGLGKRAPLIGAVLTIAFELPNIIRATKDGGLIKGVTETAKSGVRLASGIACAAVASAFMGPFIGSIVGFMVGDFLAKLVVGKSHTEKLQEAEEKQQQAIVDNQQQYPLNVNPSDYPENPGLVPQTLPTQTQPVFTSFLPQATMTPEQLMAYQNALYGQNPFGQKISYMG